MEGIFIPKEILEIKDLNITEKVVLAIYKYYTEQGKNKCCSLSKPQIADELGISVDYMKKIKKNLNELGYIRTDGGIRVIYLGVQVGNITPSDEIQVGNRVPTGGYNSTQVGIPEYPQGGTIVPTKGVIEYPHKKEKKEKENKKEEKGVTNFDLLLDNLPSEYKTPERIEYLKKNYKEEVNNKEIVDGIMDSWVLYIKNDLNKTFPTDFVIPNVEKKSDFIDVL